MSLSKQAFTEDRISVQTEQAAFISALNIVELCETLKLINYLQYAANIASVAFSQYVSSRTNQFL